MKVSTIFLIIFSFQVIAKMETDTLYCSMSLTPFENGSYYGAIRDYQQQYGGDINGDGYQDLVISGMKENSLNGELHIFFGADQLDSLPDLIIKGDDFQTPNYSFGTRFTYDGDINNDGYDDLVVSVAGNYNSTITGQVYIFLGDSDFDTTPDYILDGNNYGDDPVGLNFGAWLDIGGDINGDGIDDLLVHSIGPEFYFNGQANLFFGNENFDTVSDWNSKGSLAKIHGQKVTHGDLNGDGADEIIFIQDFEAPYNGKEILVFSGGQPPSLTPVWSYSFDDISWNAKIFLESGQDIDCDGMEDLLLAYETVGSDIEFKILLFSGNHSYFLNSPQIYSSNNTYLSNVVYTDYNNDSITDIVINSYSNESSEHTTIFNLIFGKENITLNPDTFFHKKSDYSRTTSIEPLGFFNGVESYLLTEKKIVDKTTITRYGLFSKENVVDLDEPSLITSSYHSKNYPNPFNPTTSIHYLLGGDNISGFIKIYDIIGREIITHKIDQNSGVYQFDGRDLNSGIYTYSIVVDDKVVGSNRMVLIK